MTIFLHLAFAAVLLVGCSKSTTAPPTPDAAAPPPFGSACDDTTPCGGGLSCIIDPIFPGGYCTTPCDSTACPETSSCVEDFLTPLCLAACAGDMDCRSGYSCWRGTCRPPCSVDSHCGDGDARCVSGSCTGPECSADGDCALGATCMGGSCVSAPPDASVPDAPTGSCSSDSECAGGVCLPPELGGECAETCVDRASCGGFDKVCSPILRDTTGDGASDTALAACIAAVPTGRFLAGECSGNGPSDTCESGFCLRRQCTEVCDDDGDCMLGMVCRDNIVPGTTASFRGCFYEDTSVTSALHRIPLGDISVSSGFPSSRINFAIPNDAISVTLIATQISGPALSMSFVSVVSPRETVLFDLLEISELIDQPIRWLPVDGEESIAMLVPNTTADRYAFAQGRHSVTLTAFSEGGASISGDVRLEAEVRRRVGTDIDLNVFLVGVGLTAGSAASHTRLQNALGELDSILGARGVGVGAVRYVQVTGADASALSVIDSSDGPSSELSRLFRLSEGQTNRALNLFLVRSISTGAGESGGIALGVAGGIPGPPGVHGTMHSGVVVSFDTSVVGSDFRTVAQIMSHEIGHYLGLFHSTERSRPCAAGEVPSATVTCAPFGGGDTLADTTRGDGRNLMYFALGGTDGDTYNVRLSEGQGFVMTRNPLVQ